MNPRSLAEKIYKDIQARSSTTASILRDARTLGKLAKISDFDWVENELHGYEGLIMPPYRTVDATEIKNWNGIISPGLLSTNRDWLYNTTWMKWQMFQPVTVLEDLVSTGTTVDTGTVLRELVDGYTITKIYQRISIQPMEVKKILDLIQDKVQSQVVEYLAKPILSRPSLAILSIYNELFPELSGDVLIVAQYLEDGSNFVLAARSCRSILNVLVKKLVVIAKPDNYIFSNGEKLSNFGEKTKMKFYLEKRGQSLFKNSKLLLSLDNDFREIYDIGSKALKDEINKYEANFCTDKLIRFLEHLYRYTDLKTLK